MKKEFIMSIPICLMLLFVVSPNFHFFNDRFLYAKSSRDSSSISQLQRLGTTNILDPPDNVSLISTTHKW